ncbi:hypothetical protein DSL72_007052 [Monilinia vaccinii-corymbosi]|uniref:Uncharacterized protein n=1 Tax=Monilinia vaccinii-corymbosi TaxID=61207 RepID=A0A8A3PLC6_9HELO|nr:hypothetical protein DSL72_007052 [Monilinia vaccinii-corymbosi]
MATTAGKTRARVSGLLGLRTRTTLKAACIIEGYTRSAAKCTTGFLDDPLSSLSAAQFPRKPPRPSQPDLNVTRKHVLQNWFIAVIFAIEGLSNLQATLCREASSNAQFLTTPMNTSPGKRYEYVPDFSKAFVELTSFFNGFRALIAPQATPSKLAATSCNMPHRRLS